MRRRQFSKKVCGACFFLCVPMALLAICTQAKAETEAEFAQRYVDMMQSYHAQIQAKAAQAQSAMVEAKRLHYDAVLSKKYLDTAKRLQEEADDIIGSQFADEMLMDWESRTRWGKTLQETLRGVKGLPLIGPMDFWLGCYFFRETAAHDGVPAAVGEVAVGMLPDLHAAVGMALGGGVIGGAIAILELQEIQQEVEAWKAEVRAAFAVSDAHIKRTTRNLGTDINGMKVTLNNFVDDERTYQGKARDVAEMNYVIGLMEDIHQHEQWKRNGDLNQNGVVDQNDLDVMLQNYGMQSGADWSMGDMTGDGKVDFADWLIQANEYAGQ